MPVSSAKRRLYRKRSSRSLCRGKKQTVCRRVKGCNNTRGTQKRRSYCRKAKKHPVAEPSLFS